MTEFWKQLAWPDKEGAFPFVYRIVEVGPVCCLSCLPVSFADSVGCSFIPSFLLFLSTSLLLYFSHSFFSFFLASCRLSFPCSFLLFFLCHTFLRFSVSFFFLCSLACVFVVVVVLGCFSFLPFSFLSSFLLVFLSPCLPSFSLSFLPSFLPSFLYAFVNSLRPSFSLSFGSGQLCEEIRATPSVCVRA